MNTHKHLPVNIDVEKLLSMCDGVEQIDEQKQADYIARKDKINARRRELYYANIEQCREKQRRHFAEHRDEINAKQRARFTRKMQDPEFAAKYLEYSRKYRAEHRDEINARKRKWNSAHRDEINAKSREYRARIKAAKAAQQDKEQCKDN